MWLSCCSGNHELMLNIFLTYLLLSWIKFHTIILTLQMKNQGSVRPINVLQACKWQAIALLDSKPKGPVLAKCARLTWATADDHTPIAAWLSRPNTVKLKHLCSFYKIELLRKEFKGSTERPCFWGKNHTMDAPLEGLERLARRWRPLIAKPYFLLSLTGVPSLLVLPVTSPCFIRSRALRFV